MWTVHAISPEHREHLRSRPTTLVDCGRSDPPGLPDDGASEVGPPPRTTRQRSSRGLLAESKAPGQFLTSHPAVVEDLSQQARSDRFPSVNGDDRDPTIRMPKEVMTPSDSNNLESEPPQRTYELPTG